MKKILFLLICIPLLTACSKNLQKEEENLLVIEVPQNITNKESAFKSYKAIPLETTEECYLHDDISRIAFSEKRIYAFSLSDMTVFIFDRNGNYISKIQKGHGPHEVIAVTDFCYFNNYLYVLDNYRQVKKYNQEGEFIKIVANIEISFALEFTQENEFYVFEPNINKRNDAYISQYTISGDTLPVKEIIRKDDRMKELVFTVNRFCVQGKYFTWPISNIIYDINGVPSIEIRFAGSNMWMENEEYTQNSLSEYREKGTCRWIKDFREIEKDCYFFGFKKDKDYYVYYSKGNTKVYDSLLKDFPPIRNAVVGDYKDSLLYTVSASDWNNHFESDSEISIEDTDNPIIVVLPLTDLEKPR